MLVRLRWVDPQHGFSKFPRIIPVQATPNKALIIKGGKPELRIFISDFSHHRQSKGGKLDLAELLHYFIYFYYKPHQK